MKTLKTVSNIRNKASRAQKLQILSEDPNFVKAVREICLNLVNKHLPLSDECKRSLIKCKSLIKCCAKSNISPSARKKQIINSASFLPQIVPYVDSFLKYHRKNQRIVNGAGANDDIGACE